jgi:hypothetical protein
VPDELQLPLGTVGEADPVHGKVHDAPLVHRTPVQGLEDGRAVPVPGPGEGGGRAPAEGPAKGG